MSKTKRAKLAGLVCFAIAVIAVLFSGSHQLNGVHASASGPIAGVTGCPDENDCTLCHTTTSGQRGEFFITAPSTYTPGQTYEITVTHINNDEVVPRLKWGFELTALTFPGLLPAGDLQSLPMSTLTQVVNGGQGGLRQYIEHTYEGGFEGQLGGAMWTFNWTAPPDDVGEIRLYAAGNQANGDFDNTGDQIYRAHVSIVRGARAFCAARPRGAPAQGQIAPAPDRLKLSNATRTVFCTLTPWFAESWMPMTAPPVLRAESIVRHFPAARK